jgi:hypothetical protein
MRRTKQKTLLFGFIVVCGSLLLMLLFFEIVFRTAYPIPPPVLKYNEQYVYTFNPGIHYVSYHDDLGTDTVRDINELGWYGPIEEYAIEKTKPQRILVVGDSFLAQASVGGYDKLFPERMESDTLDVVTIGVSSYAFDNYYKVIEQEAPKYDPDVIVVAVYVNDLMDANRDLIFSVENGALVDNTPIQFPLLKKTVFLCTDILRTCSLAVDSIAKINGGLFLNSLARKTGSADIVRDPSIDYLVYALPRPLFYHNLSHPEIQKAMQKSDLIMQHYAQYEQEHNVTIVFFLIPLREQVSERKLAEFKEQYDIQEENFSIDAPYDIIKGLLLENNLTVVDPLLAFKENEENNTFYFEKDNHFNSAGHQQAYEVLSAYLREEGYS